MTDADLVARAKDGDQECFAELHRRHTGYIRKVAFRILRQRRENDVDDVVQQTWMSAWAHLSGFDGDSAFRTWLTRIAINGSLQMLRKSKTKTGEYRKFEPIDSLPEERYFSAKDQHLENVGPRIDATFYLQALTGDQRRLIKLVYVEGRSMREIGELFNAPAGAMRARLGRCRRKLRPAGALC